MENIIISENKVGSFVRQLLLSFHLEKSFSAQAYYHGDVFAFQQNKPVLSIYYPESTLMGIMGDIDITNVPVLRAYYLGICPYDVAVFS